MKLVKKDLNEIKAAEYNPRKKLKPGDFEFENIKKSIENFGYVEPIVLNDDDTIISGHQRRNVMLYLGYKEADCIVVSVGKAEEKALNIALNKITGEWDFDKLKTLIVDIKNLDLDIALTGFSADEINEVVGDIDLSNEIEVVEDDFDVDEVQDSGKCKKGQVWKLGKHRLMCGDSTKIEEVKKLMDGEEADMLITDPPYGVDYTGKTKESLKIQNDTKSEEEFREFLKNAFFAAKENLKTGATFYIWFAASKNYEFFGACKDNEMKIRQELIWAKNIATIGRQDYHWQHEPCIYGWKDGAPHNWYSDRKQTTLLNFEKPLKNVEHPTMKPIKLFDYQIKNSSKKGEKVLDIFGGSGTTIMACEQNGRCGHCMEIDPHYCNVIIKRWEDYTGEKAVLLDE